MYPSRRQLLRPDRSLPQQFWLRGAEVEHGAGLGEGGGPGVDEERDAAVELVKHGGGGSDKGGSPLRLALEEASGPTRRARARRKGCAGRRTPTVSPPAVRAVGRWLRAGSTSVSGPGQ